jgi:hypothetical protein
MAVLSMGVGTLASMPAYAVVFVDDTSKTYLAPQCAAAWQKKPSSTIDLIRRATAGEAYRLRYKPDRDCVETGAFAPDGPALPVLLLQEAHVLPATKYWWDMPYRTEEGVVYPHADHM